MPYTIIDKTNSYLIIHKPAGLLTHGAEHIDEPNLADELKQEFPDIKKIGDDPWRPGIVHRLDKLASGLLVVARTPEFFEHIKKQFMERSVKKFYTALCYGKIDKDEIDINFPIKRSTQGNKMAALPATVKGEANFDGRYASTYVEVIKRYINYTLIKVKIHTGRTHQIRVHMSAYGVPLVGDDLYGTKKTKVKNAKLNFGRIFLQANELEFKNLDGNIKNYQVELDNELETFLNNIK